VNGLGDKRKAPSRRKADAGARTWFWRGVWFTAFLFEHWRLPRAFAAALNFSVLALGAGGRRRAGMVMALPWQHHCRCAAATPRTITIADSCLRRGKTLPVRSVNSSPVSDRHLR